MTAYPELGSRQQAIMEYLDSVGVATTCEISNAIDGNKAHRGKALSGLKQLEKYGYVGFLGYMQENGRKACLWGTNTLSVGFRMKFNDAELYVLHNIIDNEIECRPQYATRTYLTQSVFRAFQKLNHPVDWHDIYTWVNGRVRDGSLVEIVGTVESFPLVCQRTNLWYDNYHID